MKVKINTVLSKEEEQVVIECLEMTPEVEDIRNYCLAKGTIIAVAVIYAVVNCLDYFISKAESEAMTKKLQYIKKQQENKQHE